MFQQKSVDTKDTEQKEQKFTVADVDNVAQAFVVDARSRVGGAGGSRRSKHLTKSAVPE